MGLVERNRHFHLYVCCRGHHPIESLAAGMMQVNVIEAKELLLGVDDIVELARVMETPLDRAGAERLHKELGGWISIIRLTLAGTEDGGLGPAGIEEYLRTKVLSEVGDAALMGHLMRFSLAELVNWKLFSDLCDDADPSRLLDDMEATGLVERVNGAGEVLFTIPAPVRGVLRDQFMSDMPEKAREFHRRLGEWFSVNSEGKHAPVAFHHAAMGKDWELMDRLWSEKLPAMIMENAGLVGETLESLPEAVIAHSSLYAGLPRRCAGRGCRHGLRRSSGDLEGVRRRLRTPCQGALGHHVSERTSHRRHRLSDPAAPGRTVPGRGRFRRSCERAGQRSRRDTSRLQEQVRVVSSAEGPQLFLVP